MGKKVKENFFPTGSREDRSWRERHLIIHTTRDNIIIKN